MRSAIAIPLFIRTPLLYAPLHDAPVPANGHAIIDDSASVGRRRGGAMPQGSKVLNAGCLSGQLVKLLIDQANLPSE
jgi:hypothetical protein